MFGHAAWEIHKTGSKVWSYLLTQEFTIRIMPGNFSQDNIMHAEPCKNLQHTPHAPCDNEAKKHIYTVCVCVGERERERERERYYLLRCFDVLYCILHSIRSAVQHRILHQTTPACIVFLMTKKNLRLRSEVRLPLLRLQPHAHTHGATYSYTNT